MESSENVWREEAREKQHKLSPTLTPPTVGNSGWKN